MKHRITYTFIILSFFLILLAGCGKEEIYFSHERVEVVLSPGGVGDQGYNDMILRGLQQASAKYGFTLAIHVPEEKEQGLEIYQKWLDTTPDDDCKRSLFVFAGSEYEYLLKGLQRPTDARMDVLMFETDRPAEGIYTFRIGTYGASYLAGATSVLDDDGEGQKALVIAANPHDRNVKRAVDGYRDGYLAAGGNGCDVYYLSEEPDGGYQMQDEVYRYCLKKLDKYIFFFSVAGESNKGLYRFSRENLILAVGMDNDMSIFSSFIPISVVKHMDKAIIKLIGDLLKNKEIPFHQDFTYSSGYEELVYDSDITDGFLLDISHIKKHIVEIEQRYEESYK